MPEKRCQRPNNFGARVRALALANVNKDGLIAVEAQLQRITEDLRIPMLSDIRRAIQQIQGREVGGGFDGNALQQAVREAIRQRLDARRAGQGSVREVIEANLSSAGEGESAGPPGASRGGVILRLGRVRFDRFEEGDEILGEGAFGIVQSGNYMGREVAIKKARGLVGDPTILRDFR